MGGCFGVLSVVNAIVVWFAWLVLSIYFWYRAICSIFFVDGQNMPVFLFFFESSCCCSFVSSLVRFFACLGDAQRVYRCRMLPLVSVHCTDGRKESASIRSCFPRAIRAIESVSFRLFRLGSDARVFRSASCRAFSPPAHKHAHIRTITWRHEAGIVPGSLRAGGRPGSPSAPGFLSRPPRTSRGCGIPPRAP